MAFGDSGGGVSNPTQPNLTQPNGRIHMRMGMRMRMRIYKTRFGVGVGVGVGREGGDVENGCGGGQGRKVGRWGKEIGWFLGIRCEE